METINKNVWYKFIRGLRRSPYLMDRKTSLKYINR